MKKYLLIALSLILINPIHSQQSNSIVEFLDSNIQVNDTFKYSFSSWFSSYCGWGKSGCGYLTSVEDSLAGDTLIIDLSFDYSSCGLRSFCNRKDTSSLAIADTGNYTMIMWWSTTDTSWTNQQRFHFASDTATFRVNPLVTNLNSRKLISQNKIPNLIQNNIPFDNTITSIYREVYLYDLSGRMVKESRIAEKLNVSDLENGIYFLLLMGNSTHYKQKIIIQR